MQKGEAHIDMKVVPTADAPINSQTNSAAWRKQPYLWLVGVDGDYGYVSVMQRVRAEDIVRMPLSQLQPFLEMRGNSPLRLDDAEVIIRDLHATAHSLQITINSVGIAGMEDAVQATKLIEQLASLLGEIADSGRKGSLLCKKAMQEIAEANK